MVLTFEGTLRNVNGVPEPKAFVLSLAVVEILPDFRTETAGRQLRAVTVLYSFWFGNPSQIEKGKASVQVRMGTISEQLVKALRKPRLDLYPPLRSAVTWDQMGARLNYGGFWSDWLAFQPEAETSAAQLSQEALHALADDAIGELRGDIASIHGRMPGFSKKGLIDFLEGLVLKEQS